MKNYIEESQNKAKQEQKSDIYTKLISYPAPHDPKAASQSQYNYKRILLSKSKPPYSASEDKMSLYHAREFFCNALYAIDMWKAFFADKRSTFIKNVKESKDTKEFKEAKESKEAKLEASKMSQSSMITVKLETLVNLV